tara:strand:- start:15587 stop:15775 length:189 start_codon:yes stop_codon:yes gene_type:complete
MPKIAKCLEISAVVQKSKLNIRNLSNVNKFIIKESISLPQQITPSAFSIKKDVLKLFYSLNN